MQLAVDDVAFVRNVVRRFVDPADADDVTQESLLRAVRYRDQFRGDSKLRTWLYRIAVTTAFTHLRRAKRRPRMTTDSELDRVATSDGPEQVLLDDETRTRLRDALAGLQAHYREVLEMQYGHGLCHEDIAIQLAISLPNVKVRAFRARTALRERMTGA